MTRCVTGPAVCVCVFVLCVSVDVALIVVTFVHVFVLLYKSCCLLLSFSGGQFSLSPPLSLCPVLLSFRFRF